MSKDQQTVVGFMGTGTMGEPMAHNLLRAGTPLIVWSRTMEKTRALEAAGARVASDVSEVFASAHTVIPMLIDSAAADAVLSRGTARFAPAVKDRTIIQMGTVSPAHSLALAHDIAAPCRTRCRCSRPAPGSARRPSRSASARPTSRP